MVLEFAKHEYIDIDDIKALRWMEEQKAGVVVLTGEKVVVRERDRFDVIERAYIYQNKSYMFDDKLKKIRWVKGEK